MKRAHCERDNSLNTSSGQAASNKARHHGMLLAIKHKQARHPGTLLATKHKHASHHGRLLATKHKPQVITARFSQQSINMQVIPARLLQHAAHHSTILATKHKPQVITARFSQQSMNMQVITARFSHHHHHIWFWYLWCCRCPGLRGRQHLTLVLHELLSNGLTPSRLHIVISFLTHADHVFLGLPRFLVPGTPNRVIELMQ